ncbi:hypothetical protein FMUAM8_32320 [Nocardia cyriacigeorgica]|nr:hypothetical protein FMUAM8_32320 [Nocardia cyriacigeorgica]
MAGNSDARARRSAGRSANARANPAAAASERPCAARSNAIPGWTSLPYRPACANASSAPLRSPTTRRISPTWYQARPASIATVPFCSWQASRASRSASVHEPCSHKITDRCIRHDPEIGVPAPCEHAHCSNADVHACARAISEMASQTLIELQ